MKQNKQTFLSEVLKAEQMIEVGLKNAEKQAQKILTEAETQSANLRAQTIAQLKQETEKQNQAFLEKQQKLKDEITKTSTAEISLIKKESAKKIEKVANSLAKEVILCL